MLRIIDLERCLENRYTKTLPIDVIFFIYKALHGAFVNIGDNSTAPSDHILMNLRDTFASRHKASRSIVNFLLPTSIVVGSTLTWTVKSVENKEAYRCCGRLFQVPFEHVIFVLDQADWLCFGLNLYFMSLSRCFPELLRSMHLHLALIRHVLEGVHSCYVLQVLIGSSRVIWNTFHRADF